MVHHLNCSLRQKNQQKDQKIVHIIENCILLNNSLIGGFNGC